MRGIEELDHYEMLEVARGATPTEIDRAYRMAQETWADGSLALYSIFEDRDAAEIRTRVDEAYRVLADPELRARYDEDHRPALVAEESAAQSAQSEKANPRERAPQPSPRTSTLDPVATGLESRAASGTANGSARAANGARPAPGGSGARGRTDSPRLPETARRLELEPEGTDPYAPVDTAVEDETSGIFDGPRLRRTRMFRGYEIDRIADVTKVAGAHLRNIEDENFADLPADVYVRGFVTAYAKTIGLDPEAVLPSYMARLQESRQKSQRSRFLGLR